MSNSYIWPRDKTLSGAITSGQGGPGSDDNEGVIRIPQSSSIIGASPSDYFVSYTRHLLGEFNLLAKMQLVYSTAQPTEQTWRSKKELLSILQNYI